METPLQQNTRGNIKKVLSALPNILLALLAAIYLCVKELRQEQKNNLSLFIIDSFIWFSTCFPPQYFDENNNRKQTEKFYSGTRQQKKEEELDIRHVGTHR